MKEIKQIKQTQVENLVSNTMFAYTSLLDLDGVQYEMSESSEKFKGVAKATLNTAAELGTIVDTLIGLNLQTHSVTTKSIRKSKVYDANVSDEQVEEDFKAYKVEVETERTNINQYFDGEIKQKKSSVDEFKTVMKDLREAYTSQEVTKVEVAVDAVRKSAIWSNEIQVDSLLGAVKSMQTLATKIYDGGFEDVEDVKNILTDAIEDSKVVEQNYFLGLFKAGSKMVEPIGQTYKGSIDSGVIAEELMRINA